LIAKERSATADPGRYVTEAAIPLDKRLHFRESRACGARYRI